MVGLFADHRIDHDPITGQAFLAKSARWQLAVTPKGHRRRNFVPKLASIGYYHATCNCVWKGIIVRQGTGAVGAP